MTLSIIRKPGGAALAERAHKNGRLLHQVWVGLDGSTLVNEADNAAQNLRLMLPILLPPNSLHLAVDGLDQPVLEPIELGSGSDRKEVVAMHH